MLMRCRWLELINTQVKPGEGVRCDWKRWRTDRPVTPKNNNNKKNVQILKCLNHCFIMIYYVSGMLYVKQNKS